MPWGTPASRATSAMVARSYPSRDIARASPSVICPRRSAVLDRRDIRSSRIKLVNQPNLIVARMRGDVKSHRVGPAPPGGPHPKAMATEGTPGGAIRWRRPPVAGRSVLDPDRGHPDTGGQARGERAEGRR